MKFKILILLLLLSNFINAQPSEADIKSKLTSDVTLSIKFTKSTGTRQWNSSTGNWEYVRGVIITQKGKDFPEYKVIIGGDAVYQYLGGTTYSYWKFRPVYQYYEGIPNPTEADILSVLEKDWSKFYGSKFTKITLLKSSPKLAAAPGWTWHDPKSVTFKMMYTAEVITSNIHVETRNEACEVRLYKDDVKGGWTRFLVSNVTGETIDKKEYGTDEIMRFKKNTLAFTLNEQLANKEAAALPDVVVPDFKSAQQLADYIHQLLLNGNPDKLKTVLLQTLAPALYFNPGSTVQLNPSGINLINAASKSAYMGVLKYKDEYCTVYKKGSLTSDKHIYITGNLPKTITLISAAQVNTGYENGVAKTKWKITNLDVTVRQDDDAVNYINSFSDKELLCTPKK